ncbi:30S ribosomal protein S17 [Candidatus Kaiserbacteria bacterium CG10_big_fil_rev_8_21_14_0_10_43_70]|uniref:Small ribosomal subunit protein uS17 n=1 Tax=Candidatus Kaiserbacteria bacterium CG10_big_fil_rev_8_21_14_0_10_43_70 TaxID=1974605 RepID=A0A2H0ULI1_9BACT|nr:MAG: 30S ribosomal protein S17 [Candidatus Kaiserbacteria bacterium CG10_big_fil_rev_8_21_14_0_10_43_70]
MEEKEIKQNKGLPVAKNTAQAGKVLHGVVVKSAMKDTATVAVGRYVKDPKYKKFVKQTKKYLVHDPENTAEVGQRVSIKESRPISKRKHFVIIK